MQRSVWGHQRWLLTDGWVIKMWSIYAMKLILLKTKKENVKISDKWMEGENIIPSKVNQVPKDKWAMFSFTCESQL